MLADVVRDVLAEMEIEATLEHVTEPGEIGRYRILYTPGLVIDEELVCAGRVPSKAEVITLLTARLLGKDTSDRQTKPG